MRAIHCLWPLLFLPAVPIAEEPRKPVAPPPSTAAISGRVVGGNGEPLRRVTVALAAVKSGDSSGTDAGSAITGDNGEFVFTGLGPARYRLLAEKSGYVIGHLPRARALIAVGSGEEVKDVVLHLVPVAVVEGRILDGNGEPLAKAVVRLLQYRYMAGRRRLGVVREVLSDERGEFRMGDLDPGPYYLVASHRSSISESVCPPLYYPEVSSFDQAEPIHLRPGDDTPVKFILLPGKPVRVRGRVFGARTGAVQVLVAPRGGIPYAEPLKGGYRDGAFEFGKVLPGSYWVIAIDEAGDEILEGRTTLQVEQNDVKAVEVRLAPRHALSRLAGSVFCDCWPRVPLSGVTITLSPPAVLSEDDWETEGSGESAQADWTGHFALETASRGRYFVSASGFRAEMEDGYLSNVYLGGKDVASEGLRLPLEGVFTQLSVTLSPKGARVEGVVTDSHDQPVAGAVVVAVPAPELRQNAGRYARTTSDQNGQFVLHGLAPGDYEVYAWEDVPEGAYYDPDYLQGFAANAQTLHATKEGRHQLILHVIPAEAE